MFKKIYFPFVFKLVTISSLLVGVVALLISFKTSEMFESMSVEREESINMEIADSVSYEVDNVIQSYVDKISFYSLPLISGNDEDQDALKISFKNDLEFYGLYVKQLSQAKENYLINEVNVKDTKGLFDQNIFFSKYLPRNSDLLNSKIIVKKINTESGFLALLVGIPLSKNAVGQIESVAWGVIKIDKLQKIFANRNGRSVFLVSSDGETLAHSDESFVVKNKNLLNHVIVKEGFTSDLRTKQKHFMSPDDGKKLGAYAKTLLNLLVVSEIPLSVVFAPSVFAKDTTYYILGIGLSVSFFIIFIFSVSITTPIEKLLNLTKEIAHGNFEVVAKNEIKSRDEVGLLANAFDEMTLGLKERDKVKNLFNKFHGTKVTEELLQKEISLGGDKKNVAILFSDIRGFTDFSEGHSSEEVVSMLNEYFEVMVSIINRHGGVVDKFIGDAIMAVWGIPHEDENDCKNALRACLDMRIELQKLNESRIGRNLVPIKIGVGLHYGEAISGQIGSHERMEFTVIGDTVNTASRIEGATKGFGVDLLISNAVLSKLDETFLIQKAGNVEVQGKSEPLSLYQVDGIYIEGTLKMLRTPYSHFEAVKDKKSKVV